MLASPDPHHHPERLQLGEGGASRWPSGGGRRRDSPVLPSGQGLGSGQDQAPPRTLFSLPKPVISCSASPKTGRAGPGPTSSLLSPGLWWCWGWMECSGPSPVLPWLVAQERGPGTTRGRSGGGRWPSPQPSPGQGPAPHGTHTSESARGRLPLVLQMEAVLSPPSVPVTGSLSPADSPELGCFIYCLNTLF